MTSRKSIDFAIAGAISKAVAIARTHGRYAYGHEAKVLAEFIATEIEQIDQPLHAWEEREAGRVLAGKDSEADTKPATEELERDEDGNVWVKEARP